MNLEKTKWFPPKVSPPVPGVYLVMVGSNYNRFSYWNGFKFGYRTYADQTGVERAIRLRNRATILGDRATWCGLTEKGFRDALVQVRGW